MPTLDEFKMSEYFRKKILRIECNKIKSCVYFLFYKSVLTRIGRTTYFMQRMNKYRAHSWTPFDSAYIVKPREENGLSIDTIEDFFLSSYGTEYNFNGGSMSHGLYKFCMSNMPISLYEVSPFYYSGQERPEGCEADSPYVLGCQMAAQRAREVRSEAI